MRNLSIVMGLTFSLVGATAAFAEPAVQPGETLESLSQAKVTTTVNGQPGSLQDLISSGKYTPVTPETTATSDSTAAPTAPATPDPSADQPATPPTPDSSTDQPPVPPTVQ